MKKKEIENPQEIQNNIEKFIKEPAKIIAEVFSYDELKELMIALRKHEQKNNSVLSRKLSAAFGIKCSSLIKQPRL